VPGEVAFREKSTRNPHLSEPTFRLADGRAPAAAPGPGGSPMNDPQCKPVSLKIIYSAIDALVPLPEVFGPTGTPTEHPYSGWLANDERMRARNIIHSGARAGFVAGRMLLRRHLGIRLGCSPADVNLRIETAGRPELEDTPQGRSRISFNLSHSASTVVLALSASSPVGVDIESPGRSFDIGAAAVATLGDEERHRLSGVTTDRMSFLAVWTAKEAVAKAIGTGFRVDPTRIRLEGQPPTPGGAPVAIVDHQQKCWWVASIRIRDEICAIATDRAAFTVDAAQDHAQVRDG
jgi:4'-phosphopantetheinyl transferase